MINLLIIDDSLAELELIKIYFESFEDVRLTTSPNVPSIEFINTFDCVMIDQYLADGQHGLDVAMQIKKANWLLPMMLYTADNYIDAADAKTIVDEVCYKHDIGDLNFKLSSFFRQVNRLKHFDSKKTA